MIDIKACTQLDMPDVFALRTEVFVVEQNVPTEEELDGADAYAVHFIAREGSVTVGCGRVIRENGDAHIGRLAVKKDFRGRGVGYAICRYIIDYCNSRGDKTVWLNSQLHAVGFYEKLGFIPEGETFFEAGIEHIRMIYT